MHKTKVSRAVAPMEKRKLLTRRRQPRRPARGFPRADAGAGRSMYDDLAPIALDFANRLAEVIDPAGRAAFERSIDRLTERSAKLAAEFAKRPARFRRRLSPTTTEHRPADQT